MTHHSKESYGYLKHIDWYRQQITWVYRSIVLLIVAAYGVNNVNLTTREVIKGSYNEPTDRITRPLRPQSTNAQPSTNSRWKVLEEWNAMPKSYHFFHWLFLYIVLFAYLQYSLSFCYIPIDNSNLPQSQVIRVLSKIHYSCQASSTGIKYLIHQLG